MALPTVRLGRHHRDCAYLQIGPEPSNDDPRLFVAFGPEGVAQDIAALIRTAINEDRGLRAALAWFVLGSPPPEGLDEIDGDSDGDNINAESMQSLAAEFGGENASDFCVCQKSSYPHLAHVECVRNQVGRVATIDASNGDTIRVRFTPHT